MKHQTRSSHAYLWELLRPLRWHFLGITLLLAAEIWLTVLTPIPARQIINDIFPARPGQAYRLAIFGLNFGQRSVSGSLGILSAAAILVGVLANLVGWMEQFWTSELTFRVQRNVRQDFFRRLFRQQQGYLDSQRKVDLVGRLSGDVENLELLLTGGFPAAARDLPMIGVLIAMMFSINLPITLFFLLCLPVYYFTAAYFTKKNQHASREMRRQTMRFETDSFEALSSMAIAKSLRGERRLLENLQERVRSVIAAARISRDYNLGLDLATGNLNYVLRGAMYLLGGWAIFRGEMGIGELFQFLFYSQLIERYLGNLNKFVSKYPKCSASLERVTELDQQLSRFPEVSGSVVPDAKSVRALGLAFEGVDFQHDPGQPLLMDFHLTLGNARLVAIVGQSGIGKSSFSRLLNRLHDPVRGRLTLGGRDLRDYELPALRRVVRVLSQDNFLIAGTVRENLLLASDESQTDEKLWKALQAVNAADFVRSHPQGLDARIGEGGVPLSGGQMKRLHLARAFLDDDSEILLIDEPTSGLDVISAEMVMASIQSLARAKALVFWITHRLQEVQRADKVLFFSRGENPVQSTHASLFAENAAYRALVQSADSGPGLPKNL